MAVDVVTHVEHGAWSQTGTVFLSLFRFVWLYVNCGLVHIGWILFVAAGGQPSDRHVQRQRGVCGLHLLPRHDQRRNVRAHQEDVQLLTIEFLRLHRLHQPALLLCAGWVWQHRRLLHLRPHLPRRLHQLQLHRQVIAPQEAAQPGTPSSLYNFQLCKPRMALLPNCWFFKTKNEVFQKSCTVVYMEFEKLAILTSSFLCWLWVTFYFW